jgi:hypothetical protein
MKVMRDPDAIIGAWLEDGPTQLPDATRRSIVAVVRTADQRRRTGLWDLSHLPVGFRLAIAAAVMFAAIAGGALLLRGATQSDVGGAAPSATPSPSLPTASASALETGTSRLFKVPFEFAIPEGSRLELTDDSPNVVVFRVKGAIGYPQGINLRIVDAGHLDTCLPSAGTRRLQGADAVLDYLRSVPGLTATDAGETTVDGRPAASVDLVIEPGPACPDIYLWPDPDRPKFDELVPPGPSTRMTAFEVDGATVVIVTWAEDLEAWLPTADQFVESLHFLGAGATPTPDASSPASGG